MRFFKRFQYNSPLILTYTFVSLAVLLLDKALSGRANVWIFGVYRSPLNDPLTYVRIWAHVLGHESFSHYLNNFLLILLVGPMLEEKYGAKTLLITMFITALATGLLFVALSPANYIMYGASGIVFMLILLSSYVNIKSGRVPITLILVAVAYIGRELYDNFYAVDNISQTSHIIGGIIGAVAGFFINRKKFLVEKRPHHADGTANIIE